MFLKNFYNLNSYTKREQFTFFIDEDNLDKKTKWSIKKMSNKLNYNEEWNDFKAWTLWKWVNKNFNITEKFYTRLMKNAKKLDIRFTVKEEKFLRDIQELHFTTWRPFKELAVNFELSKKEHIRFSQSDVNVHHHKENKATFMEKGDLYYSNFAIYLCDEKQEVMVKFKYSSIEEVDIIPAGVIITAKGKQYLFRGKNKFLVYVTLQRMMPKLKLDILKYKNLYDYFDFWNSTFSRFN